MIGLGMAVRDSIEAGMLVTGTIEVDPEGRVERFEVDRPEALPKHVLQLLDKGVPAWRFEPMPGISFSMEVVRALSTSAW